MRFAAIVCGLVLLLFLSGCSSCRKEILDEAPVLQVHFFDLERGNRFSSATVLDSSTLLVSPHQLPLSSRTRGAEGEITLLGNSRTVRYMVVEIVLGDQAASGYAYLKLLDDAGLAGPRLGADFTVQPKVGSQLYIVGYPQGPIGGEITSISPARKILAGTVVRVRPDEEASDLAEWVLVRLEDLSGDVGGASGGPAIVPSDKSHCTQTVIGIFGGAFQAANGDWIGLVRQPNPKRTGI